jgi:predicted transcriptional regulator
VIFLEIRNIRFFSDKEEAFIDLLRQVGLTENCAKILVFLVKVKEASSRDIEHGTDLRQPEISIAIKTVNGRGWIGMTEHERPGPGRKIRIYRLTIPLKKVIADIERENREMISRTLARVKQLREFI